MKKKIKILYRLLLVTSFFAFTSCEKDLYEDALQPKKDFSMKSVSLKDLSNSDNPNLFKAVDKIRVKKMSVEGRIVYDSINKIYFDDENGKMIEKENGYKSFTFPVYRKDGDDKIENILFTKNPNGEYNTYIVKYSFTDEELKYLTQQQLAQQTVTYTDITAGRLDVVCVDLLEWQAYPIDEGDLTGNFGYTGQWVVISSMCENIADNDGSSTPANGGTASTGWGTGTFGNSGTPNNTGGTQGGGVHTSPVVTPGMKFINRLNFSTREYVLALSNEAQQVIFNYLTTTNFSNQNYVKYALENINNYEWLFDQSVQNQVNIFNYLAENNFSSQSTSFLNQMINLSINDHSTFTFDNSITAQNAQVFSNVQEFQSYISNIQNQTATNLTITNQTNPNKKTSHATFQLPLFLNVTEHIDQNIKTNSQPWSINSITFDLSGLTLGSSWTQGPPDNPITFIGNFAFVHIPCYLHLNAFTGGYGNFYTHEFEMIIKINTLTGEIVDGVLIKK